MCNDTHLCLPSHRSVYSQPYYATQSQDWLLLSALLASSLLEHRSVPHSALGSARVTTAMATIRTSTTSLQLLVVVFHLLDLEFVLSLSYIWSLFYVSYIDQSLFYVSYIDQTPIRVTASTSTTVYYPCVTWTLHVHRYYLYIDRLYCIEL
jgi:hypothetical protein